MISEDPGDLLNPVGRVIVSAEAVEPAVEAAKKAFPAWSRQPLSRRIQAMKRFQRVTRRRRGFLTTLMAREAGKPLGESTREAERLIGKVDEMVTEGLKLVRSFSVKAGPGLKGQCRWRPLGALAVIGPFNFPAHTPASHIIPALLTGNTVIFKPSEHTPFVGQVLAELIHAAGFPPGVFNLVQGARSIGERLTLHPGVAGVLFTGSTAAGQMIKKATLDQPGKSLAMEMGGKNAALLLEDAEVKLAAREIAAAAFSMGGQRCNATSRVIVHRRLAKRFKAEFLDAVDRVKVGYSLEPDVLMGPLISHDAVDKFRRYMKMAEEEGFQTLRTGKAVGSWGERRGYYVTASVHWCDDPGRTRPSRYRREEIFGPDVAVYVVRSDDEAVALNNEVPYGLITSLFTRSKPRFERLLPRLDTGMVNLNRGTIFSSGKLPFGGTKASGSFRPAGLFSPYYCTVPVAILEDTRPLSARTLPV